MNAAQQLKLVVAVSVGILDCNFVQCGALTILPRKVLILCKNKIRRYKFKSFFCDNSETDKSNFCRSEL